MRGHPMLLHSLPLDKTILSTFMNPFSLQCLTWIVHWAIDCNTSCSSVECVFSIVMRLRTTSRATVSSSLHVTPQLLSISFCSPVLVSQHWVNLCRTAWYQCRLSFYCCPPLFLLEGDYSAPLTSPDMNKRFELLNGIDASPFGAIRFDV